ncbi:MAG: metal-dependent hydrolase, partial [Nevskiales bacterium]
LNTALADAGFPAEELEAKAVKQLELGRKLLPPAGQLAATIALEHFTAIMAEVLLSDDTVLKDVPPQMAAMWRWHGIEETEHKAVAFDVLKKVAKASYFTRIISFAAETFAFPFYVFLIMDYMFKVDGVKNRFRVWMKGLWWLYGWGGLYPRLMPHYLAYFLPGFHPWKFGNMKIYETWTQAYADTQGDPVEAGNILYAAASGSQPA